MPPMPEQIIYEHERGATCSVQGCTTATKARGRCGRHGNKRCSHSGCATAAQADGSGLCNHHGGGHRCVTPGCTKNVTRNNRCIRHQPVPSPGCSQVPQSKGIRKQHSSRPCTMSGCTTLARSNSLCTRHGGGRWWLGYHVLFTPPSTKCACGAFWYGTPAPSMSSAHAVGTCECCAP